MIAVEILKFRANTPFHFNTPYQSSGPIHRSIKVVERTERKSEEKVESKGKIRGSGCVGNETAVRRFLAGYLNGVPVKVLFNFYM